MALRNAFGDIALDSSIKELLFELVRLARAATSPRWLDPSQNRLRETAVVESGTITTVNQFAGYTAQSIVFSSSRTAWNQTCRSRIT